MTNDPISNDQLESNDLDIKGCIVIIPNYINFKIYKKIESFGASGVIVGGFDYNDMSKLIGKSLGVAVTGNEDIFKES